MQIRVVNQSVPRDSLCNFTYLRWKAISFWLCVWINYWSIDWLIVWLIDWLIWRVNVLSGVLVPEKKCREKATKRSKRRRSSDSDDDYVLPVKQIKTEEVTSQQVSWLLWDGEVRSAWWNGSARPPLSLNVHLNKSGLCASRYRRIKTSARLRVSERFCRASSPPRQKRWVSSPPTYRPTVSLFYMFTTPIDTLKLVTLALNAASCLSHGKRRLMSY